MARRLCKDERFICHVYFALYGTCRGRLDGGGETLRRAATMRPACCQGRLDLGARTGVSWLAHWHAFAYNLMQGTPDLMQGTRGDP